MKKSFLILLSVLLIAMLAFAGCNNNEDENNSEANSTGNTEGQTEGTTEHTHTFAEEWSSDAENHWHASTCDHKDEKSDVAAHVDEDGDGMCDVCKYSNCEHTYDESKWSSDADSHWHASTCGHNVKKDESAHKDENKDGICDVCEYVICAHTYANAWSSNELSHWKMSTCGCFVIKDKANHDMAGEGGSCSVCGAENIMGGIIDAVTGEDVAEKIASGSVNYNTAKIDYQFGNGYTHILYKDHGEYADGESYEYWHYMLEDSIFSLRSIKYDSWDYGISKFNSEEANLLGYVFSLDDITYGDPDAYGVENLIYQLYNYASIDGHDDVAKTYESYYNAENGEYGFTFYVLSSYTDEGITTYTKLVVVSTTFTISEGGAIATANVNIKAYWDYDNDFTVDENGVATVVDGAEVDAETTYSITQVEGERNATPYHDMDKILAKSFAVTDENGNALSGKPSLELGNRYTFGLSAITPDTAYLGYDTPEFSAQLDGEDAYCYITFDESTNTFYFLPYDSGTLEITIKTALYEVTVEFEVLAPQLGSLTALRYADDFWNHDTIDGNETMAVGETMYISIEPDNWSADYAVNANCTGGTLQSFGILTNGYKFTATEAGEYTLTFTSIANPEISVSFTVTVGSATAVNPEDVLSGTWTGNFFEGFDDHDISITFSPSAENVLQGTIEVVDKYRNDSNPNMGGTATTIYSYKYSDDEISINYVSGDDAKVEFALSINAKGKLCLTYNDSYYNEEQTTVLNYGSSNNGDDEEFIGMWANYNDDGEKVYSLTIFEDGTATLYDCGVDYQDNFTWVTEDGTLYLIYSGNMDEPYAKCSIDGGYLVYKDCLGSMTFISDN